MNLKNTCHYITANQSLYLLILAGMLALSTIISNGDGTSASTIQESFPHETWPPNNQIYLPIIQLPQEISWPTLAANQTRTSWTPEEVKGNLNVEWYRPLEPYIPYKVQPIAADGKLFISTARGLYTFNAADGTLLWIYSTEAPLGHSPTVATINNNLVAFVGGHDRKIHAINANTGQPIVGYIPYLAEAGFETNPLVIGNSVFAGNQDGYFYALDAVTGNLKWRYKTGGAIRYSAAYKNGVVYFASDDAHAYALNAVDGNLIWKSAKLPGEGFHSFWPVIYSDQASGVDYVIFSSGENYRFNLMNLVIQESDAIYEGLPSYSLIGPTSNSIPGDWIPGTVVIDATILTNYFESRPDRRTIFVLDGSTGQEFIFDSDGDGVMEYAPFNWSGTTHSGSKYPPLISGYDGIYYQATGYITPGWISRGAPVGWKFGTNYISRVSNSDFASDEPLAYSGGGSLIYYALCCDRAAGAFDVAVPYGQGGRSWSYYNYNLANNMLAPGYQQMYDSGTLDDYNNVNGWQLYSGRYQSRNGVYGKHGGTQSPPIPYQGKVYLLKGNSLIAFSPDGTNPISPLPLATLAPVQAPAPSLEISEIRTRLEDEIVKILAAGPLRPGYHDAGFIDLYGSGKFSGEREFGEIFDYFQNPADTVYTLLLAYPHLSPDTQQQVKTYLQAYYGPGATYDFTQIVHVGWGTGAAREHLVIPQEVIEQWYLPYGSPYAPSTQPICGTCGYWQSFPPFSFYAAWQYAQIVGNSDPLFAKSLFDAMSNKLEPPLPDHMFSKKPYWLNLYIAGYKGYLELQQLAGYEQSQDMLTKYQNMLNLRANGFAKDTPYPPLGGNLGNPNWEYSYNNALAVARNFMFLTPELGDYLSQTIYSQVETAVAEYEYVAPYWFVSQFDHSYGEGTLHHLYDSPALFQARAYILKQSPEELAKWIGAPSFHRGDLFLIQNLVAVLGAVP